MDVKNSGVIITGGASGLGSATARRMAGLGARVTLFDLNADAGQQLATEIGGRFASVDVTDDERVAQAVAEAEAAHGATRILVNCAGIAIAQKTIGKDGRPHALEQFRKVLEINLLGTFNLISKVAARLVTAEPVGEERGVFINTASVAAFEGQVGQAAYAASKGGVHAMTLPIARELAGAAIRVCTIAPGIFWTPMLAGLPEEAQASLGKQVPFPSRLGKPEEYADLVAAIIANPMLNGETIRLDGAIRMAPR
ncbi:SDR family NAD(P)-dependent oxidoreductase [Sphingobium sp. EM0848]|uniref:SDR family NAD(P)-dependent oxidoreductase n=1 Tax=Sphingobium sp. EM0848 TaxID=2743473 RepID=UPI00159C5016|nr:SDR family NAD(P)-dependent oxidoreductase [Sphingobium sp. EM0848]